MQSRHVWPTQIGGFLVAVGFLTGISKLNIAKTPLFLIFHLLVLFYGAITRLYLTWVHAHCVSASVAFLPAAICEREGAGNFVWIYVVCVLFIGFPLTYLHLCLGQYSGCNPTQVFGKLCPAFRGIGWCWLTLMVPMMIISNMNAAWSLYYMYVSGRALISGQPLFSTAQRALMRHGTIPVMVRKENRSFTRGVTEAPDYFQ